MYLPLLRLFSASSAAQTQKKAAPSVTQSSPCTKASRHPAKHAERSGPVSIYGEADRLIRCYPRDGLSHSLCLPVRLPPTAGVTRTSPTSPGRHRRRSVTVCHRASPRGHRGVTGPGKSAVTRADRSCRSSGRRGGVTGRGKRLVSRVRSPIARTHVRWAQFGRTRQLPGSALQWAEEN